MSFGVPCRSLFLLCSIIHKAWSVMVFCTFQRKQNTTSFGVVVHLGEKRLVCKPTKLRLDMKIYPINYIFINLPCWLSRLKYFA